MSGALAASRARDIVVGDRAARVVAAQHEAAIAARDQRIEVLSRAHEVTRPGRSRKLAKDWGSANRIVGMDAKQLRDQARHLERDLDLARNALNILVQNTCGSGIDVLAAPRLPGKAIDRVLAQEIDDLWDEWWDSPEVTKAHDYGRAQQLAARSWFRDGECFYQDVLGPVDYYVHGTTVRYSFELLEADLVPLDFNDPSRRILQGAERNSWGEVIAWHLFKQHPGEGYTGLTQETKRVPSTFLRQIALLDRMHQVRGLTVFASSMSRFEDVKDYEESERIAAKVAASMSGYIKKGDAGMYERSLLVPEEGATSADPRALKLVPGAIFDDLLPGEEIGTIDSKRPNPNAATWRKEQLRAAAGGIGTSYSSLSLDYNGSYSSQRQELVEKWGSYQMLAEQFIALKVRRQRHRFIEAALLDRLITLPRGWKFRHLAAATYVRPVMPWIDPLKEAYAKGEAEDRGWASPQQNTLLLGNNPAEVATQIADWREQQKELGLAESQPSPADDESRARVRTEVVRSMLTERA